MTMQQTCMHYCSPARTQSMGHHDEHILNTMNVEPEWPIIVIRITEVVLYCNRFQNNNVRLLDLWHSETSNFIHSYSSRRTYRPTYVYFRQIKQAKCKKGV